MIKINQEKCISCGACQSDCVAGNIEILDKAQVKSEYCLMCGHCVAICPENAVTMEDYPMNDVKEYNADEFVIESDRLLNFIKFRRSVRQFTKDPVEEDKILKIIEAGRYTATGSNRQDVSYIVVKDKLPELRRLSLEKLSAAMQEQAKQNASFAGLADRWTNMLEADREQPGKNDKLFYNAPTVLMIASGSPVDAALAASNMELMAVAQGLGVFYCGFFVMASQGDKKIKDLIGLNDTQEVRVCLVLGYPEVTYRRTVPRKPAKIDWR